MSDVEPVRVYGRVRLADQAGVGSTHSVGSTGIPEPLFSQRWTAYNQNLPSASLTVLRLGARVLLRTLGGAAAAYSPPDLGRKESLVAHLTGCEVTHRAATGPLYNLS